MNLQDNSSRGLVVVSGKMGAGKTMFGVRWMLEELAMGRIVYSNIKLEWPACKTYFAKRGVVVPPANYRVLDTLTNFHEKLAEDSFVVLDEAQLDFNNRDFKATDSQQRELLTFIPQARKWGCHVVIITQHEGNVDTQFLRQAEYYYRAKDLWHYPLVKMVLPFPVTTVAKCDTDGKTVLDRFTFIRKQALGDCYNTRQKFKAFHLGGAPATAVAGVYRPPNTSKLCVGLGIVMVVLSFILRPAVAPPPVLKTVAPVAAKPVVYQGSPPPVAVVKPAVDPRIDRDAIEQALPGFTRVYGSSSIPGDVSGGGHWRPAIRLESGREIRVGGWLCGRVISWVKNSSSTVLVAIDHPLKTITLYDCKLHITERNSGWRGDSRGDVGRDLGGERGIGGGADNAFGKYVTPLPRLAPSRPSQVPPVSETPMSVFPP